MQQYIFHIGAYLISHTTNNNSAQELTSQAAAKKIECSSLCIWTAAGERNFGWLEHNDVSVRISTTGTGILTDSHKLRLTTRYLVPVQYEYERLW